MTFRLGNGKLTPELTLCKYTTELLLQRLHEAPGGGNFGGNFIGNKILGWLDKGIQGLLGEEEGKRPAAMDGPQAQVPRHMGAPQVPGAHHPPQGNGERGGQGVAAGGSGGSHGLERTNSQQSVASSGGGPENKPAQQQRSKLWGFSSIGSSVGSLIRSTVADSSKEAKLGKEENAFYYDEKLKRWRERGKEEEEKEDPGLKEPPKMADLASAGAAPQGQAPANGPPGANGGPPKAVGNRRARGVRSRYVDTFNTGGGGGGSGRASAPALGGAPAFAKPKASMFMPPSAASLVPSPAGGGDGGASGPAPPAPAAFMPTGSAGAAPSSEDAAAPAAAPPAAPQPAMFVPPPPVAGQSAGDGLGDGNAEAEASLDPQPDASWASYDPMGMGAYEPKPMYTPPGGGQGETNGSEAASNENGASGGENPSSQGQEETAPWNFPARAEDDYQDINF